MLPTSPLPPVRRLIQHESIRRSIVKPVALAAANLRGQYRLPSGAEIWITDDGLELSLRISEELTDRGFKPRIVNLEEARASSVPHDLSGLIIVAPQPGMTERQLWGAVEWLQAAGPTLRRQSQSSPSFVATVSHLDGRFGFEGSLPLKDPISGGIGGTCQMCWPRVDGSHFTVNRHQPRMVIATPCSLGLGDRTSSRRTC